MAAAVKARVIEQGIVKTPRQEIQPIPLLKPRQGRLYTYRLVQNSPESPIALDLGFGIRLEAEQSELEEAGATRMVQSEWIDGAHYHFVPVAADPTRLYTFSANVLRVIDGDTLLVDVDCGFSVWIKQRLRLRGVDSPEINTARGIRAQAFVESMLAVTRSIVLATARTDKYDRYVADVYYAKKTQSAAETLENNTDLNQELLDHGLAVSYSV